MTTDNTPRTRRRTNFISKSLLLSISYLALESAIGASGASAQSASQRSDAPLPPVTVTSPEARRRASSAPVHRADRGPQRRRVQTAHRPEPMAPITPTPFAVSQDARTGTVGVYTNSTSVATKTNTPLVNIPQSLSVITKDFIQDQSFQGLTDVTRYVPGVSVHQGEGNRDELVIRAASTPVRTSSSTASATTCNISAISITRKASRC
jgi:catecholate siderophore receptor